MDDVDGCLSDTGSTTSTITSVSSSRAGTHVSESACDCEFMACEKVVRIRTANFTFKEGDVLKDLPSCTLERLQAVQQFQWERGAEVHRVLREWSLELIGHGCYNKGYCVPIADPLWSLCKALFLCERHDWMEPTGCHCLSKAYFMVLGCYHPGAPDIPDDPQSCQECQRCLRCNGPPGLYRSKRQSSTHAHWLKNMEFVGCGYLLGLHDMRYCKSVPGKKSEKYCRCTPCSHHGSFGH